VVHHSGANGAIALGTYFGGWRIVHTMGAKITKLKPVGGFCAETAGAITLSWRPTWAFRSARLTPSRVRSLEWAPRTASRQCVGSRRKDRGAWILTIPASALVAAVVFWIIRFFHPGA